LACGASEVVFGPALRGELRVVHEASAWRATLASAETRFEVGRDSVRFEFPGALGEFRGRLTENRRVIAGFWIQPAGLVMPYPFASPLALRLAAPGVWRGTVVPLDDRFSLYLAMWTQDDGTLVGAFRNPELNSRGGASQFRVMRTSDSVVFTARPDPEQPEVRRTRSSTRWELR